MRLGTKLLMAFILLVVLPLTWITVHSYNSSIAAFRKAVEAESGGLAEEMGGRMETMRRELAFRIEHLSRFPFQQLMATKGEKVDSKSNPLMAELMAEIGDAAPLVDAIEFHSSYPSPPPPPVHGTKTAFPAPPPRRVGPTSETEPQRLVIQLSPETPPVPAESRPGVLGAPPQGPTMHFRPSAPPGNPNDFPHPLSAEEKQKLQEKLEQIREFQVVLEKMGNDPAPKRASGGTRGAADASRRPEGQAPKMQRANPLANDFGSEVRADGNTVGTVWARVSPRQMFRNVLSGGRRRPGDMAFVIDSDGKVHTLNQSDERKLADLGFSGSNPESKVKASSPELRDWVIVTRKDEGSNVTFGIARPISEPLRDIRNTLVRNLFYGLGMVGLALIGIIPLSHRMTRNLAALTECAEQLASGNLNARVSVRSRDEIGRLAESFNRMAYDLNENQKNLIEQERLRKELEMSRRIQEEMLPKRALHVGPVEVKGVSIPAREVGGDFFNYFQLDKGEVAILVGDVSGKGVAAALLMANVQATLHARLPMVTDLAQLARQLDLDISANTPPEVYLTLFMSILDPAAHELRYVNAGHHPQFAIYASGDIGRLESTGRPLGLLPGGDYQELRIKLSEGDSLFLYTDGLVETGEATGREFSREKLENLLLEARTSGINEILAVVETETRKFRGEVEAADDATMLVLKIGPSPARS